EELLVHELFVFGARNLAAQPHLGDRAVLDELVEQRRILERVHVMAELLLALREQRDVFLRRTPHAQRQILALISSLCPARSHRVLPRRGPPVSLVKILNILSLNWQPCCKRARSFLRTIAHQKSATPRRGGISRGVAWEWVGADITARQVVERKTGFEPATLTLGE